VLYLDVISWCCVGSLCYCAVVLDHYVVELYHDVISWCSIRSLSCCYMSWCYFIMLCCGSLPVDVISSYADIVSQCYIRLLGCPSSMESILPVHTMDHLYQIETLPWWDINKNVSVSTEIANQPPVVTRVCSGDIAPATKPCTGRTVRCVARKSL